jgi:hypothetical protein
MDNLSSSPSSQLREPLFLKQKRAFFFFFAVIYFFFMIKQIIFFYFFFQKSREPFEQLDEKG